MRWVFRMTLAFTFLAQRTFFSSPDFSFHAQRETWPFGRRSLAHLQTLTEPVDWLESSTIPDPRIASASRGDTGRLVVSVAWRRAYPSPNSNDPRGIVGSGSRSGILALIALIWARRTPRFAMFANILLCDRTSLPNDPTAFSMHHWAQPESGPQRRLSGARWISE